MTAALKKKNKAFIIFSASLLLPAAILLLCFYSEGFLPFGDKSLLIMDMSNQYVEFFAGLRRIILSGNISAFSWNMGFGQNMIGLFSYYLSSPFSFITLFFPDWALPLGITVLTLIKSALCGLAFSVFLKLKFQKNSYSIIIFSALYALNGYAVGYSMCIMWIDSLIWLPLTILALERLIDKKGILPFVLLLFVQFISNYYCSYMTGIFCLLYFIYYFIVSKGSSFFKTFARFVFSAALAAGMSAFLILPTIFCMFSGKIGAASYAPDSAFCYNPFVLISKLMTSGSYDSIMYDGTPFVYSGVISVILLAVFFMLKKIPVRDKIMSAAMIAVIIISSAVTKLDIIWHVFKAPNWFPHRNMFVLSFFILMCAYKAFTAVSHERSGVKIIISFSVVAALFLLSYFTKINSVYTIALNIAIAAALCAMLFIRSLNFKTAKIISIAVIAAISILDVFGNSVYILNCLDRDFSYESAREYSQFKQKVSPLVSAAAARDNEFYRMEKTFERSKNDAFGFNMNGIGHYSSAYDRNTNAFLKSLGFAQDYIWCSYLGSTPLTDSVFGVKYILSENEICKDYVSAYSADDITAYANPYALPVAFAASPAIKEYAGFSSDPFYNQNRLLNSLAGKSRDYFRKIERVDARLHNFVQKLSDSGDEYLFTPADNSRAGDCSLNFTFNSGTNPVYAYFPSSGINKYSAGLYVNGEFISDLFTSDTDRLIYLGTFEKGERVRLSVVPYGEELKLKGYQLYSLDLKLLKASLNELTRSPLKITEFTGDRIRGTVEIPDDSRTMFTSIRYDDGWSLFIDGEKHEISTVDDALICFDIFKGSHTIELKFTPKGLVPGIIISAVSSIVFMLIFILGFVKKRRKN